MIYLVLFLLWPVIEIALLIKIGGAVGIGNTLLLLIGMAVAGGMLVQYQGLKTMASMTTALERGELPGRAIFDGICIFTAGVLFLIPGFFSDIIGLLLLLPPLRKLLHKKAARFFIGEPIMRYGASTREEIIEAEFTRMEEDDTHGGEDKRLLP